MKTLKIALLLIFCVLASQVWGCSLGNQTFSEELLHIKDVVSIELSAPHGSGAIRKLTLSYQHGGGKKQDTIDYIYRVDCRSYNDDKQEQKLKLSDFNFNGIFYIIIYREFWFPDISLSHAEIPEWPTIYEYSYKDGFIAASSKHRDYFDQYIKASKKSLSLYAEHMSNNAILAQNRLIIAAEQVEDGSFAPQSPYNNHFYYADVYDLTKLQTN